MLMVFSRLLYNRTKENYPTTSDGVHNLQYVMPMLLHTFASITIFSEDKKISML